MAESYVSVFTGRQIDDSIGLINGKGLDNVNGVVKRDSNGSFSAATAIDIGAVPSSMVETTASDSDEKIATSKAMRSYVDANGGKIDSVYVSAYEIPITNKTIDLSPWVAQCGDGEGYFFIRGDEDDSWEELPELYIYPPDSHSRKNFMGFMFTGGSHDSPKTVNIYKTEYIDTQLTNIQTSLDNKQSTLVSGTNIKTINNQSILGSGNITIAGGLQNLVDGSATGSIRGIGTTAESSTYTLGAYAFAEGETTKASGSHSHAEGAGTIASGSRSHAEGNSTTASGIESHAEGKLCEAAGAYSHAQNNNTIAAKDNQTTFGRYNIIDTATSTNKQKAFIIGNGTDDEARSNALTVDWEGEVELDLNVKEGTSSTAAGTTKKIVTTTNADFELKAGAYVLVTFANENIGTSVTLAVDGTGLKTVYYNGSSICNWKAGATIAFRYDGTYYQRIDDDDNIVLYQSQKAWNGSVDTIDESGTVAISPSITASTGTLVSSEWVRYGNVVNFCIGFKNTSSVAVGSNVFVATINDAKYRPVITFMNGTGYSSAAGLIVGISNTGSITVRVIGSAYSNSGTGYIQGSYIING